MSHYVGPDHCNDCRAIDRLQSDGITTPIELVLRYFPSATRDEADHILWNETAFPFNGVIALEEQLKALASRPKP